MANTDLELGDVGIVSETVKLLLAREVKGQNRVHRPSIFKVPSHLRNLSPNSYNPQVVSIGPLHREAANVQDMEAQKPTKLHHLLASLELELEPTLEACVQKLNGSIDAIRGSYHEMKTYTDVDLIQMMVMDGFFILEFFYNRQELRIDSWFIRSTIFEDLLLLENQIPFVVLQDLFECTILKCEPDFSLILMIANTLRSAMLFKETLKAENFLQGGTPDHILGILHNYYLPEKSIESRYSRSTIHSAVELDRAGVKFKPTQDPSWSMAIKVEPSKFRCFSWSWGKPTLRLPVLCIEDCTELILRNLIVYEQSAPHVPYHVTSYAIALDHLVDTKKDIAMLVESGILDNNIGSNEDAANMINNISKGIIIKNYYTEEWDQLDRYYNGYWPKSLAHLRRTYFNSPWNIIALLAGIVLFALTIVQTVFTIKAV